MILVDTSVWIAFFRNGDEALQLLLNRGEVLTHPYIIGELACGNLRARRQVLDDLAELPRVPVALHEEVMLFIERYGLMGAGVGYLDMHLLASAVLAVDVRLWTGDKKLATLAGQLSIRH